jgi:anti-anti-sigma factor
MEITREKTASTLIIHLDGHLDANWCDPVEQALTQAVKEGEHSIRLDMAKVSYISSAGLRVVLNIFKQLRAIKGSFGVVNASSMVESVFSVAGMSSLLSGTTLAGEAPSEAAKGRTHTSPRAAYDLFSLPGKGVWVETRGDASVLHGGLDASKPSASIRFTKQTVAIGVGALGTTLADCASRLGEFLTVGGVSVYQPADGSSRPDYLVSEGQLVPEGHLPLGLVGRGDFSLLARFQAKEEARTVGLGELAAAALEMTGSSAAFIAAVTETAGLVGTSLRHSLVSAPSDNFTFPQIRDWLSFTSERSFRDSTSLVVGLVAREGSPQQSHLRPLAPGLFGHFHAASFTYQPLQKGFIDLVPTLGSLFEGRGAQAVLHLLPDNREYTGSGESEFLRGALWIAPVEQATTVPSQP